MPSTWLCLLRSPRIPVAPFSPFSFVFPQPHSTKLILPTSSPNSTPLTKQPPRIKTALRKSWLETHPDKIKDFQAMSEEAQKPYKDAAANVGQAAEIFKDEKRKREYDASVEEWERRYGDEGGAARRGRDVGGKGGREGRGGGERRRH